MNTVPDQNHVVPADTSQSSDSTDRSPSLQERYLRARGLGAVCIPFGIVFPNSREAGGKLEEIEEELTSTTRGLCQMIPSSELPHPEAQLHLDELLRRELSLDCQSDPLSLDSIRMEDSPLTTRLERLRRNQSQDLVEMEVDLEKQNQDWMRQITANAVLTPQHIIYNGSDSSLSIAVEEDTETVQDVHRGDNQPSTNEITPVDETSSVEMSYDVTSTKVNPKDVIFGGEGPGDATFRGVRENDISHERPQATHLQEMEDETLRDYLLTLSRNGMFEELRDALEIMRELHEVCPPIRQNSSAVYFDALETASISELEKLSSRCLAPRAPTSGTSAEAEGSLRNVGSSMEYCELWSGYTSSRETDDFPELGTTNTNFQRLEVVHELPEVRVNSAGKSHSFFAD